MNHIHPRIVAIHEAVAPLHDQLCRHPLYDEITSLEAVHVFMESHVFAVWDFMCLLKSLQRSLTCVDPVWAPVASPETCRLINEIVLGEESDLDPSGDGASSHFELYVDAMRQCGADTRPVSSWIEHVRRERTWPTDLAEHNVPAPAARFLQSTRGMIENGSVHTIASCFTFGRENVIPEMFQSIVEEIDRQTERLTILSYYLRRHIEVDGDEHGPLAYEMISRLCGDDGRLWDEVEAAAQESLKARITFWDDILEAVTSATTLRRMTVIAT